MEIRHADPEDAEAVHDVARDSWDADYPGIVTRETIDEAVEEWYDPDTLRAGIDDHGTVVLVADAGDAGESTESGEGIVGFAHAAVSTESWTGTILRLYVHPDHRGEGIGGQLLDETIEALRERDCERIEAMALADNEMGNEFYRAGGFEHEDTGETVIAGERYEENRYVYEG